ncbi:MAG: tail fiber protein [Phycisphaeraceae bacterium]|nr:tail fiber protein [Phycisphaeraceae bacterium]
MPADPYLGDLMLFAGNFEPANWMFCDGRLLPVSEYGSLFNLIGNTYGGIGSASFALPDLRGRVIVGSGTGPGLTPRTVAQSFGTETVSLTPAQMAAHNHSIQCASGSPNSPNPEQRLPAVAEAGTLPYATSIPGGAAVMLDAGAAASTGSGAAHENIQPSIALNYCICVIGTYPPQP